MGRASDQVDVNRLICVLYVYDESAVAEHVQRALIVEKNTGWIKAYRIIIHVVRYLVKSCAWRGIGVVVVFFVRLGVVFYLSIALVCFMFDVHT